MKLKPCPFCGAAAIVEERYLGWVDGGYSYKITCSNFGCPVCVEVEDETEADAAEAWNTRKKPPAKVAVPKPRVRKAKVLVASRAKTAKGKAKVRKRVKEGHKGRAEGTRKSKETTWLIKKTHRRSSTKRVKSRLTRKQSARGSSKSRSGSRARSARRRA